MRSAGSLRRRVDAFGNGSHRNRGRCASGAWSMRTGSRLQGGVAAASGSSPMGVGTLLMHRPGDLRGAHAPQNTLGVRAHWEGTGRDHKRSAR